MAQIATAPPAGLPAASLRRQAGLTLGALGVVFGDIGTSPLYAMRESALAAGGPLPNMASVMGALSLIFWASWGGFGGARRDTTVIERDRAVERDRML